MNNIIKDSYVYKILVCISNWINKIFSESMIVRAFMKESDNEATYNNTFFQKLLLKFISFLQKIAHKIKLDKAFENSIFAKPIIWLSITIFCAPFLPTMLVLLMLICTALSLILKIAITKDFKLKYFKTNVWILIFVLVVGISAMTSISLEESRNIALLMGAFILSYFVVINTIENKKQFKFILYLFIIAAVLTAVYGLYQYKYGDLYSQAWLDTDMFEDIKMRVYSTFENPNVYGEYLILAIPIIISLMWEEKGIAKKLMLLAALGITMLAMVLTFSRGCWLGAMFAIALLAVMIDRRFIILGILALMAMPFVLPETIINRFMSIGNMGDSSTSYRVYIWLGTLAMLKDYWFSGIGMGITSFNTVYPIYSYNNVTTPHSHNLFLQIVVEYGIVGLIIFAGVMYNFYKETIISVFKNKNVVTMGFISGVSGFMIESLFDHTWYNYRVVLIFWIVIALGILSTRFSIKEEK
jgi:putative inorganic carbon (HCO3(-)) transporter